MAEKDTLMKQKLKQSGIFDFKGFYEFAYDWFIEQGYELNEKTYTEKVSGEAKDIEITWEAKKKISDYFQFQIKLEWRILGLKKVKIKKGDKEVNMDSGSLEIKFNATLIKDYESRWEDHPLWKFLRGVYDRYIIKSRIDDYENKLLGDFNEIITQCKAFLGIKQ